MMAVVETRHVHIYTHTHACTCARILLKTCAGYGHPVARSEWHLATYLYIYVYIFIYIYIYIYMYVII